MSQRTPLEALDAEKSFKTQIIVGLGAFIITTFFLYWIGVKQEGLIFLRGTPPPEASA